MTTQCCLRFLSCRRGVLLALALIAWGLFGASLIAEKFWGLIPCSMCLYQRYIHFGLGVLGLMLYRISHPITLLMIGFAFWGSAGVAGYHVGIEHHIFALPKHCVQNIKATSMEDLRQQLTSRPTVRCDVPAWTFLGLSMAGYNLLMSLGLGTVGIMAYRKQRMCPQEEQKCMKR